MRKTIEIFYKGKYICSTRWADSLKEAKSQFLTNMKNYPLQYFMKLDIKDIGEFERDKLQAGFKR